MDMLLNSVSEEDRAEIFAELSEYVQYKKTVFQTTQGVQVTSERKKKKAALTRPSTELAIKHLAAGFIEKTREIFEKQRTELSVPVSPIVNKNS